MPEDKRFTVRSIRILVEDQEDVQAAANRLGDSIDTTSKWYRSNVTRVKALLSDSKYKFLLIQDNSSKFCVIQSDN